MQRLFIIYNPNSSQYIHVKKDILENISDFKGYTVGKIAIEKSSFEDNVLRISKILKDGDIAISVGGDATAAITVNAIIKSGKDVRLGVLPYGNFNDLARTLKTNNIKAILSSESSVKKFYPLEILVDGRHFRYATCYVTIGMTAEAVELFDNKEIRKDLKKGRKSSWRSYIYLAKWYFRNRHKKLFIPEFKLNGVLQHKKTSDYAAVNGSSMCRVMKGDNDYLMPKTFRSETDRLTNFWRLFKLMVASIIYRVPGSDTKGDILEFLQPATVELQAEGEYKVFKNIKKIEIKKTDKYLKVFKK